MLSEADLDYFLLDMKTDENGEVAWQDFLRAMKERMREPESVKMLKEAFRCSFDSIFLVSAKLFGALFNQRGAKV